MTNADHRSTPPTSGGTEMLTFNLDEHYFIEILVPEAHVDAVPEELGHTPHRWRATGWIHRRDNGMGVGDAISEIASSQAMSIHAVLTAAARDAEGLPHPPDGWTP